MPRPRKTTACHEIEQLVKYPEMLLVFNLKL